MESAQKKVCLTCLAATPDTRAGQSPLWKEETIEKWQQSRKSASWNRKK